MPEVDAGALAAHRAVVEQERAAREERLRDPMGWLTLVGLHWLQPGRQAFGGAPGNEIVLQAEDGHVPPVAGTLEVIDDRVLVHPSAGATVTVEGRGVIDGLELIDDEGDAPTVLELASLRLQLIRRGERGLALRVRDTASRALQAFEGLRYFEVDGRWQVVGRLIPAAAGATIAVPDVIGNVLAERTPGVVEFELEGRTHRLDALEAMPGHLWLIFGDATNGSETYGGGRFLVSGPVREDDSVEVDFNLAYNPPCVFSPYATCPLPPDGNRLNARIEAGEMVWTSDPAGTG